MKKILFPAILLLTSFTASAQFSYEFVNYNSANTPVFSGNNFKCIWIGKGNRIWAGTQYQGLYWFDTARKAWTKSSQLTNVFINQIQNDKNGGIWIAQSGTSGLVGGGSNTAGGVNYFPDTTDAGMQFFSTGNFLSSRNVRGVYLDTFNAPADGYRRIWVPQATFTTSSNTAAGGFTKWQETSTGNFQKVFLGLQVFPNTNLVSAGTPSCYTACGDKNEVWIGAETNYTSATGSTTQILRYDPTTGQFLGGWDQNGGFDATRLYYNNQARNYIDTSTKGILPAGFRTTAMYIDGEGRRWVGFRNGGLVVKTGTTWKSVNMPAVFPAGTTVNFNAITSDEFGYIYIGTSNGLVIFDNGGDVTDTTSYKRLTTTDSLPSNNITGVAYDKLGGRMLITSDAGVTFMKYNYKIKVDMEWDYSYPSRVNRPIGVAADGVARIYLKIKKRSDTLPDIQSINVKLKNYSAARANERGKLKNALVVGRYSEEASSGTTPDVTINYGDLRPGTPNEYWVWYVAPNDFCSDSTSSFAPLRRRYDTLVMIATYANNTKDTMEYKIGIVRPPTLFVHGLASSPATWDSLMYNNFGNYTPFVTGPVLTYKRALTMDPIGVFQKNGAQLLGADVSAYSYGTGDRLNTLQGNIEAMRNEMRYAANRVDYVCHSMGGIMIRTAIGLYANKFFSGASDPFIFKNYDSGYTHKVITINTPHNGAPIADVLDEYIPLAQGTVKTFLNAAFEALPQQQALGGLLKPVGGGGWFGLNGDFVATDAVNNLQVTSLRGGVRMLSCPVKNHMIVSNVNWDKYKQSDVGVLDYGLSRIYGLLIQISYYNTFNTLLHPNLIEAAQTRARLRDMMALEKERMIGQFLNYMSDRRNYPNYISYSDLVVPLRSQTAQQDENLPFVSKFLGNDTITIKIPLKVTVSIIPPISYTSYIPFTITGLNGNHSAVLSRKDIGTRVFQLLNTKLTSNVFSNEMPVNDDAETPYSLRPVNNNSTQNRPTALVQTFYDTTKVKIDAPVRNGSVFTDSIFQVKFRIKDTTRLAYYTIHFQNADSFRVSKTFAQQTIDLVPVASYAEDRKIWLTAAYDNASGTGVDYYVDSVTITPNNLATLQGFRVKPDVVEIVAGRTYYTDYEVNYGGNWVTLPVGTQGIAVSIDSVNVVSYDTATKSFNGLKEGGAIVNFTYNGFADSLLIKVIMPYNSNCVNKTLTGGSFKNPTTWSKGIVPGICDSVVINTGHTVTVDTSVTIRAVRISSGGTLIINNATYTLQLGQQDEGFNMADNYGTLNISNGGLLINGRIKFNASSTFTMSGGTITLDANKGVREMSIPDGVALFEAAPGMTSFNFSGGTLQVNNPPYGATSQTLNCPYDFGNNSTLVLGINTSGIASKNTDGFGGLSFPNKIGRLIVNAGTRNGNRQFTNKKALTIKGNAEVRTGSGVVIQAPITVNQ